MFCQQLLSLQPFKKVQFGIQEFLFCFLVSFSAEEKNGAYSKNNMIVSYSESFFNEKLRL
jgi:hypothetical protein